MTALIITIVAILAFGALVLAIARARGGSRLRNEELGNPHPDHADPLVRKESRHSETPGGELGVRDRRHDA